MTPAELRAKITLAKRKHIKPEPKPKAPPRPRNSWADYWAKKKAADEELLRQGPWVPYSDADQWEML
jgi:hypothetical protein